MTNNSQLASTAFDKLNAIKVKHESDRSKAVSMMKKIYTSYNALKDSFAKLTIEHGQVRKDLERAHAEIRRLEKANGELSNDVMMLSSAVSLLDQTVGEGDDILIDSIRDVVRDFKLDDVPAPTAATAVVELVPAAAPARVPSLAEIAANFSVATAEREPFALPELVSDEELEAASGEDLLSGDDVDQIEQFLNEELRVEVDVK